MTQTEIRKHRESGALKRMDKNRQIKTLTEDQHDALRYLCDVRHEIHSNQTAFFYSNDPIHEYFEIFLGKNGVGTINEVLQAAGLPAVQYDKDIFKVPTDQAILRKDYSNEKEYELAVAKAMDESHALIEQLNERIEDYLKTIDRKHKTHYCPKGTFRYPYESKVEKVEKKYDRSYAMVDFGKQYSKVYGKNAEVSANQITALPPSKPRIFVDMDGTLAVFNTIATLEDLYQPGYFRNLAPQENVVEAVRDLIVNHKDDVDVYILSAVLSDSPYALNEKNSWLDEILPEIDYDHRIFPPCGDEKNRYIPLGLRESDLLLDDYTVNLKSWEPPARAIKLMNGINGTKGSWVGPKVEASLPSVTITNVILKEAENTIEPDIMPQQQDIFMTKISQRHDIDR